MSNNSDEQKKQVETPPRTLTAFIVFVLNKILEKKKYWLLPVWCLLVVIAIILFLTGNGALLPAIYMAF